MKETLEDSMRQNGYHDKPSDDLWREGVEFGAKWHAERSYSEEEVLKAQQAILCNIKDALQNENYIIEYLEQFKKK